jgi:predicted DNA binding protein
MRGPKPVLLEIDAVHPCWCIESANKCDNASISLISSLHDEGQVVSGIYDLRADDVERFIDTLRKHKWVKEIRVIEKARTHALAFIRSKHDALMIETIAKTRSAPLEPTLTRDGKDTVAILVPDERALRTLASTLRDDFEVKLKYKKTLAPGALAGFDAADFMRMQVATSGLSGKQRDAFLLATRKGYWRLPKRVDIAELAREAGVDEATFSEHLRKAEAKLMPFLADLMDKAKSKPAKP